MKVNKEREGAKFNNFNKQLFFWGESRTQHTFVTLLILLNSEFFFSSEGSSVVFDDN